MQALRDPGQVQPGSTEFARLPFTPKIDYLRFNADQVDRIAVPNRPVPVQYVEWAGRALTGDLGRSIQYDLPVTSLILSRLAVSLQEFFNALAQRSILPANLPQIGRPRRRVGQFQRIVENGVCRVFRCHIRADLELNV